MTVAIIEQAGRRTLGVFVAAVCAFSLLPIAVVLLTSFTNEGFIRFPPRSFGLRYYADALGRPEFREALAVSVVIALVVSFAAAVIGTLAAYALTRTTFRGRTITTAFLLSPLVVPHVIIGVALLQTFVLARIPVAPAGLLIGHLTAVVPLMIGFATASLAGFPRQLEWASLSLGAGRVRTFFQVTLPGIAPGILSGLIYIFIYSFDEATISLFTTRSNFRTLPVVIFGDAVDQAPVTNAMSGLMLLIAFAAIALLQWRVGLFRVLLARGQTITQ